MMPSLIGAGASIVSRSRTEGTMTAVNVAEGGGTALSANSSTGDSKLSPSNAPLAAAGKPGGRYWIVASPFELAGQPPKRIKTADV